MADSTGWKSPCTLVDFGDDEEDDDDEGEAAAAAVEDEDDDDEEEEEEEGEAEPSFCLGSGSTFSASAFGDEAEVATEDGRTAPLALDGT